MRSIDTIKRDEAWTYSSGPTHQLATWEPYLQRLKEQGLLEARHAFVHCINQYPIEHIYEGFPWDLWLDTLRDVGTRQIVVILDSHTEGPSWQHVSRTVQRMIGDGVDPRCVIQWTGGSHESDSPIQTVTVMDAFSLITNLHACTPQPIPTHHYVMLARIPKDHRVLAAVEILQRGLDRHGHISCGSGDHGGMDRSIYHQLVPSDLRDRFPLLLPNGYFSAIYADREHVDSVSLPEITGAFCSVIPETSHDLLQRNVCTAFMTEKSEKCFLLEQVPIWIAAPGQVALAREWGLDCFDDIIDHAYDDESDPRKRISMAIDQLASICDKSIEFWQRYKIDNQERFTANRQLCMELRIRHPELQYHKLVDCMRRMPAAG